MGGGESGAVEVDGWGGGAGAGELVEDCLGVWAGGREHGTPAAGSEACAQGGLVGGEAAAEVVGVAEVVAGGAGEHGRGEGAGAQRRGAPGVWGCAAAGEERRGRGDGGDGWELGAAWGLGCGASACKGVFEGIRLEGEVRRGGLVRGEVGVAVGAVVVIAGTRVRRRARWRREERRVGGVAVGVDVGR